ncbi:MAG: hypothetical protein ACYCZR_03045 [Burkholderiales bacterium]
MRLVDLKDRHKGEDIWVLGSGATLNHVDPEFFRGKTMVVTNHIGHELGIYGADTYSHSHYHSEAIALAMRYPDNIVVTPEGDRGYAGSPSRLLDNIVHYPHHPTKFDFTPRWMPDGLVVGSTSLHGSMHLAAHMGAATIMLAGADCGVTDGESNHRLHGVSGDLEVNDMGEWLARWNRHLIAVKEALVDAYGVRVMSLCPWVNLHLEGHDFR